MKQFVKMQSLKNGLQFNVSEGSVSQLTQLSPACFDLATAEGGGNKITPILLFFWIQSCYLLT